MKKKIIAIVLCCLLMIFGLAACGNADNSSAGSAGKETANATSSEAENPSGASGEDASGQTAENGDTAADNSKILVAYFSATHTTEGIADKLADGLGADIYEIMPKEPYTSDDLNYSNDNSRSSKEMNDPDARPEIADTVENMDQYDTVLIGYPIWWGEAPRIINTFLESYDFSGKIIVPFCTSASSDISSSQIKLEEAVPGANWMEGKRFSGSESADTVMEWVNGLGISQK